MMRSPFAKGAAVVLLLIHAACGSSTSKEPMPAELPTASRRSTAPGSAVPKSLPRVEPTYGRLSGHWFGETTMPGRTQRWVMNRRPEGDFDVRFKVYEGDRVTFEQIERGVWGADEATYVTITTQLENSRGISPPAAPNDVFVEEYAIESLDDREFRYRHKAKGTRYTVRRVEPNAAF